eukprot:TRINITY_DN6604_c0_g1_i1.p1 TRINITY_DN6604_c0_g1~~TRINITY_DN6604_c0_g1_i1.p1  ORF type:complete len:338 (+),score=82.61 TRINITY_DN6604_c0_g1_i1:145-1158(+)
MDFDHHQQPNINSGDSTNDLNFFGALSQAEYTSLPSDLRTFISTLQNHIQSHLTNNNGATEPTAASGTPDEDHQLDNNTPSLQQPLEEITNDDALIDIPHLFEEPSSTSNVPLPERSTPRNNNRTMIRFIIVYETTPPATTTDNSDPVESIQNLFEPSSEDDESLASLFEDIPEPPRTPNLWRSNNSRQLVLNLILNYPGSASPSGNDFEDVLNRLFMLHEPKGPPPTSKDVMDRLHTITVDEESLKTISDPTCTVCYEELECGDTALELPCSHCFHKGCVSHWLKDHNTCPVCRFELPTDDQEYEKQRVQRMADRKVDEAAYFAQTEEEEIRVEDI